MNQSHQQEQLAKLELPKPKAQLILANGQRVSLDNKKTSALKEKDGTRIEKGDGNLKYQAGNEKGSYCIIL